MTSLKQIQDKIKGSGYCDLYFEGSNAGILFTTTRIYGIRKNNNCKAKMYLLKYIGGEISIMGNQLPKLILAS